MLLHYDGIIFYVVDEGVIHGCEAFSCQQTFLATSTHHTTLPLQSEHSQNHLVFLEEAAFILFCFSIFCLQSLPC